MTDSKVDPRGFIKLQTSTKTLLIQPFFGVAISSMTDANGREKDPEPPFKVFDNFSRCNVVIIDTTQDPKAVNFSVAMQRKDWDEYKDDRGPVC